MGVDNYVGSFVGLMDLYYLSYMFAPLITLSMLMQLTIKRSSVLRISSKCLAQINGLLHQK